MNYNVENTFISIDKVKILKNINFNIIQALEIVGDNSNY